MMDRRTRKFSEKASGVDNEFQLAVRSAYMRLFAAWRRAEPYPAGCIDANLLAYMLRVGDVERVGDQFVMLTDAGRRTYAAAVADITPTMTYAKELVKLAQEMGVIHE